jgi:hypothetical protein
MHSYPLVHYGFVVGAAFAAAVLYGLKVKPTLSSVVVAFAGLLIIPMIVSAKWNIHDALAVFSGLLPGYLSALVCRFIVRREQRRTAAADIIAHGGTGAETEPHTVREPIAVLSPERPRDLLPPDVQEHQREQFSVMI